MTSTTDTIPTGLLIGGERVNESSGGTHPHTYPATGQPNAAVTLAGAAEINRAVASAWDAHREWMSLTVDRRRDLLIDLADVVHEHLDELSRLNVHDYAVPISFAGNAILLESGQSCACASRVLVHESVYDAFVEKFVAVIEASTIGDPLDPNVVFGPVISQGAVDRILGVIDQTVSDGSAELITGGQRLGGDLADGYYIEPTVFAGVDNASELAQTETFGPVVSVMKFSDDAEAVRIANATRYGLNAFVQTNDLRRAHRVSRQLEAGSVWVNTFSDMAPQGPYGGYKQSGFGRTGGLEGLNEFLQVKNIRITMP